MDRNTSKFCKSHFNNLPEISNEILKLRENNSKCNCIIYKGYKMPENIICCTECCKNCKKWRTMSQSMTSKFCKNHFADLPEMPIEIYNLRQKMDCDDGIMTCECLIYSGYKMPKNELCCDQCCTPCRKWRNKKKYIR